MPGGKYEGHPSFDYSMDHKIIFCIGITVLAITSIYFLWNLLWNKHHIPKIIFLKAFLFLLASIGIFYLALKIELPWPIIIIIGLGGIFINIMVFLIIKHGKTHKSDN